MMTDIVEEVYFIYALLLCVIYSVVGHTGLLKFSNTCYPAEIVLVMTSTQTEKEKK